MLCLGRLLPHGLPAWLFWFLIPGLFVATSVASEMLFLLVEKPMSLRPASLGARGTGHVPKQSLSAPRLEAYRTAMP